MVNDKEENDEGEDEEEDAESTDFDDVRSRSSGEHYADSEEVSDVGIFRSQKDEAREDVKIVDLKKKVLEDQKRRRKLIMHF